MQYRVPQFIEHESKILGPLNLRQSLLVGGGIAACFFLYFIIGQENFTVFLLIAIAIIGTALAISFTKVEGLALPTVLKNFLNYNVNPRIYLWQRKEASVYLSAERQKKPVVVSPIEKSPLKLRNEGRIEQLAKKIDFEKTEL